MPTYRHAGALALALALSSTLVLADSQIVYKATEGGGSAANSIVIGQGKVRVDQPGANSSVIFDPVAGQMTVLDHGRKTYMRIGKAELQQMADLMQQLEGLLANLPPEALQMVQGRLGGAGGGQPVMVTQDTGQQETVAGRPCRVFRTTMQGRPSAESCMGDAAALDLSAADRETLAAAMAWSQKVTDTLAKVPMMRIGDVNPFRGSLIPLRSTTIDADGTRRTSVLSGVTHDAVPAETFAMPADYTEQKIQIPRIGGRR